MKKFIVLLFLISFYSCEENKEILIDANNLLIGNWVERTYNNTDETIIFKRGNKLPEENYGISFKPKGNFLERTSGFCGTPPLSYFNVDGIYLVENNLISITTQSYPNNFIWKIVSLSETELVVKREFTEQEKDHQNLMKLFDEVYTLANNNSCINSNDFAFTGYGAKACGGVQGYIVYSKNIDSIAFLKKVQEYSKAEQEYNIKWGIISDCSVVNPPKKIECKNGYPRLIY